MFTKYKLVLEVSSKVLFLGTHFKEPKGGVAQVLKVYSSIFDPFIHIATTKRQSRFGKALDLVESFSQVLLIFLIGDIKVVHIHGSSYNSFWRKRIFINLSKIFRKKIVYHIHGGEFQKFYEANQVVVKRTLLKCDVVIALSDYWKFFLEKETGHPKVQIVENIVKKPIKRKNNTSEVCTFLFLGTLVKEKGVFDLLDTIRNNKETLIGRSKFHIGGNGEEEKLKTFITENQLEEVVCFEGWVSGDLKTELLSKSDVFILPSYNEGLPISVLEAMSYGLPIISTPVGGIPEVLEHNVNGLMVTPGDKLGLNKAIEFLILQNDFRTEAGKVSFKKVQNHFPIPVKRKLEKIYLDLLG